MLLRAFPAEVQKMVLLLALATGLALGLYFGELLYQLLYSLSPNFRSVRLAFSMTFPKGGLVYLVETAAVEICSGKVQIIICTFTCVITPSIERTPFYVWYHQGFSTFPAIIE